ncbi:Ras GTPase activating protein IRA2 NDAI_0B02820 [Naumovozyma dairenensis CBS 421]|uniref:Ras-GAP domain-containing protein n=1 Tax=Naumovozyma dairenensis (strain ATCC 10597 / BCRC 20456 / CBS 421 / NBRC 0211 / NRRL Y-12639) TaxID=1071378 RepID=G0W6A6_NAUDC|nr:hypothetical protein NDAI_0B02820 [Naumovozyma dairenensis CBS 421]CCD23317.1 hypothetical protein NDAI_0B02820 [Naumovozyma dairenensis CBS 421]
MNRQPSYMVDTLVKHFFNERIFPILPIESGFPSYLEVESEPSYISCRSVIMNIAISKDLNPIAEQTMNLIETILKNESIISQNTTESAIQSILALLRLLSDTMEYFWDYIESHNTEKSKKSKDEHYEKKKNLFSGSIMGYSVGRSGFHQKPPNLLNSELALRLINLCSKLKFNTRTLDVLRDMASNLYGVDSLLSATALVKYQTFLKQKNNPEYARMVDITLSHILRFVAASNPNEFFKYIRANIQDPLTTASKSEFQVVQHFEMLGCAYITIDTLPKFLNIVKLLFRGIKRIIFTCMLLFFSSKSLTFWYMARPNEYVQLFDLLKNDPMKTNVYTKTLTTTVSTLFDQIYSDFDVANILSSLQHHTVLQNSQTTNTVGTATQSDTSSTNSNSNSSILTNDPSLPQVTIPATSLLSNVDSDFLRTADDSTHQPRTDLPAGKKSGLGNTKDTLHLENILELYTYFDDTEILPHTAILRFLITLVVLDTDTFVELNSQHFEYLSDPEKNLKNVLVPEGKDSDINSNIKHITSGLKKLTTLQLSKKKSVKFMTLLIKNLNGAQAVAKILLPDSLRAAISLVSIMASVHLINKEIPSAVFAKRLISLLGSNLELGSPWSVPPNKTLVNCLDRNSVSRNHIRLKFFAAALQFDPDAFLAKLGITDVTLPTLNLEEQIFYTEAFRVFFHLPSTGDLRKEIAYKTSAFFKSLFCSVADILLEAFPYFNDKISDIVSSILDGTILDEFGTRKLFRGSTTSLAASLNSASSYQPSERSVLSPSSYDGDAAQALFFSPSMLSKASISRSSPTSASQDDDTSTSTSSLSSTNHGSSNTPSAIDLPFSHLITPRTRPVGSSAVKNRFPPVTSLLNSEKSVTTDLSPTSNLSASLMTLTNSTPTPTLQPYKLTSKSGRLRRYSEESTHSVSMLETLNLESPVFLTSVESMNARKIMINIFSIFKRMTNYFILPHSRNANQLWISSDFKNIIKPIFVAIVDSDRNLQSTARAFMDVLVNYIKEFSADTSTITVSGYFLICSYTISLFSMGLFDLNLESHKRGVLLDIVQNFLKLRSYLGTVAENTHHMDNVVEAERTTFPLIVGTVGRALFVSLHTDDPVIQKKLRIAFAEFLTVIKFHQKYIGPIDKNWIFNLPFLEAMSKEIPRTAGAVAAQRHIRTNILKHILQPDSILLDSMNALLKKWYHLAHCNTRTPEETANFRSIAGIIASVSGPFLVIQKQQGEQYPYLLEFATELRKEMNYFIGKQCEWLNSPDLLTRENSREILGDELHPLSFKLLFDNLKCHIRALSDIDLTKPEEEYNFILLQQLIAVLRSILKRSDDQKIMVIFSIDVIDVISQLMRIIKGISKSSRKYYRAIIYMTKVIKALEYSENSLALKHHYHLKNKWLKLIISWFKSTISKELDLENLSKPHREVNLRRRDLDLLYIDTAIESSIAIAYLTENLPLEIPVTASEEEGRRSESVIYGNYFNILLKGLEKSMESDKFPPSLAHKMSVLNENIILALSNLSNANIEASLQFSVPMGYSKNRNIKNAFLKVFTNSLSQYPLDKGRFKKSKLFGIDKLLLYTVKFPQLVVAAGKVCPAHELDAYAAVLINGFETRNASHLCVSELIKDEIEHVSRPMDILRRNSCATRALSLLSRTKGNEFLIKALRPVLQKVLENKDFFEVEKLDPNDPEAALQVALFEKYMTDLLASITEALPYFPPEFFYICQTIYTATKKKFPDYAYIAAGSFVFLRLICPALVSPESENIIEISNSDEKRPFISLAKVIQNIANGSDNLIKWPSLANKSEFLKKCSDHIFQFLVETCRTDREINIVVRTDPEPIPFDFDFLHRFLYMKGFEIRKVLLDGLRSLDDCVFFRSTFLLVDKLLGDAGPPEMKYSNEIPPFIREHIDEYPQLYEFMSRHAFKKRPTNDDFLFVHESMSNDGIPIITLMLKKFKTNGIGVEDVAFKFIQIYSRIWITKHCLVLDCTEFSEYELDIKKLNSLLFNILPSFSVQNCIKIFLFNATEVFLRAWLTYCEQGSPYLTMKTPHCFINSNTDGELVKSLGLTGQGLSILQDIRISLKDVTLYNSDTKKPVPIVMKIGNKYLQVLQVTPKLINSKTLGSSFDVKFNQVFRISEISSVHVSSTTGASNEFTVNFVDGASLIFYSQKYLEIVKMFYYAQMRLSNEYGENLYEPIGEIKSTEEDKQIRDNYELIGHLILVILVGLYDDDDIVKNNAYNLMATSRNAFNLNFGANFRGATEIYVPNDTTTFVTMVSKSLAECHPELTPYICKYILNGLETGIILHEHVPQTICAWSYWIPNLYEHIYLLDDEEGPDVISRILRTLIRLTVSEPDFATVYHRQVWSLLGADGRLTAPLVEEIINHALERDSEDRDWKKTLSLLTGLPTVEVACTIVQRLMKLIKSFLPSLRLEALTQSWSELMILVKASSHLFFEAPFLAEMFLPELLFIVSLLIDVGPPEIRSSLHELLMNVCHSLTINEILPEENRRNLDETLTVFSRQKMKFIFGFSQDKGRLLQNFSASSFSSKFTVLDYFTTNIMLVMDYASTTESAQWKTKFKKYLTDAVFQDESFLASRAMMMLGIIGQTYTSEMFCRSLLQETLKTIAQPVVTDELIFLIIAQLFTYSKVVQGLDPSLDLMTEMFWLTTVFIESPHAAIFQGGLIFMTSCLDRLYMNYFNTNNSGKSLISLLINTRGFASPLLKELETMNGIIWNEENFVHILTAYIKRGLTIPFTRNTAISTLHMLFKNTYLEHRICATSNGHLNYLYLLFQVLNAEEFSQVLEEVEYEDEMIDLNDVNKVPKSLLDWLSSGCSSSSIALYQSALLFNGNILDESSKLRTILVIRYLLHRNPRCIFNFYVIISDEIRKAASMEHFSDCGPVAFDIISLLVLQPEFNDLAKYNTRTVNYLKEKGLYKINITEIAEHNFNDLMMGLREDPELLLERKRLTVMILSRMACHV